jgi:hypothetical protein
VRGRLGEGLQLLETLSAVANEVFDGGGGDVTERAADELLLEGVKSASGGGEFELGLVGELAGVLVTASLKGGVELFAHLAAPGDEGGLGDAELASDGGEAMAVEPELVELVASGLRVHSG